MLSGTTESAPSGATVASQSDCWQGDYRAWPNPSGVLENHHLSPGPCQIHAVVHSSHMFQRVLIPKQPWLFSLLTGKVIIEHSQIILGFGGWTTFQSHPWLYFYLIVFGCITQQVRSVEGE